ncbi:MAG: hypothetical protein GEV08_10565 [Acidimicrobiia bacterium]|nr:hypothetical protein [Acidimicrobiia bacterium]
MTARPQSPVAPVLLALFLTAGAFKSLGPLGALPVDVTLLLALLVATATAHRVLADRFVVPSPAAGLLLLVAWVPPLLWSSLSGYSSAKVGALFTLTALAILATPILLRSAADVRSFFHALAAVGVVTAVAALTSSGDHPELYGRLATAGGNTITLGRTTAVALLWMLLLLFRRGCRAPTAVVLLVGVALTAAALVGSGSRGPALGLLVAMTATIVITDRFNAPRSLRLLVSLVGATAFAWLALAAAPESVVNRFENFTTGTGRPALLADALALVPANPLGVGWGDFGLEAGLASAEERVYPHNFVVESAVEAGLVGVIAIIVCTGLALHRARARMRLGPEYEALFALLCFTTLNALVSGDLNDNRLWLALVALAIAAPRAQAVVAQRRVASGAGAQLSRRMS